MNYPIEIVTDLFGESPRLAELVAGHKVLLVADSNIVQHAVGLGKKIGTYVMNHGIELVGAPVVIGGGERIKMDNFKSASQVVSAAIQGGLEEDDFIVALGGGTVLDVAGWASAQVFGGVNLIRIPTTPAAVLGGAFAEEAALNLPNVKDAFVVPCEPKAVLVDVALSNTVLDGVWRAGISEAVSFLYDTDFEALKETLPLAEAYARRELSALSTIAKSVLDRIGEAGIGTCGRELAAELEPKSAWKLPHGYALAIGVLVDCYKAVKAGERKDEDLQLVRSILEKSGALDGARHSKHILPPELADFW